LSYRVLWSDAALARTTEFFDFIAEDSPAAARRAVQEIVVVAVRHGRERLLAYEETLIPDARGGRPARLPAAALRKTVTTGSATPSWAW
jgi:plasmid stabilization system protein ParE